MKDEKIVTLHLTHEEFCSLVFGLVATVEDLPRHGLSPEEIQADTALIDSTASKLFQVLPAFSSRSKLDLIREVLSDE